MKRVIAIVFVLGLLLIAGCGNDATPVKSDVSKDASATADVKAPAGKLDTAAVESVDSDIGGLDDLDAELDTSDVDSLDKDLDFEI